MVLECESDGIVMMEELREMCSESLHVYDLGWAYSEAAVLGRESEHTCSCVSRKGIGSLYVSDPEGVKGI